jgi:hypothetical protein
LSSRAPGAQFIELHTGSFAESFAAQAGVEEELARLVSGAEQAHRLGLRVNAGHGLNYDNLPWIHRVPHLVELNIGHSIVSRAVMVGMEAAVRDMLRLMAPYRGLGGRMVLGLGIDIIEVGRIQASYEKFGERFLNRILHPNEISYSLSTRHPGHFWRRGSPPRRRFRRRSGRESARNWAGGTWRWRGGTAANLTSFCMTMA